MEPTFLYFIRNPEDPSCFPLSHDNVTSSVVSSALLNTKMWPLKWGSWYCKTWKNNFGRSPSPTGVDFQLPPWLLTKGPTKSLLTWTAQQKVFCPHLNPCHASPICLTICPSHWVSTLTPWCLETWQHSEGQVGAKCYWAPWGGRSRETPGERGISLQLPEAGSTAALGLGPWGRRLRTAGEGSTNARIMASERTGSPFGPTAPRPSNMMTSSRTKGKCDRLILW